MHENHDHTGDAAAIRLRDYLPAYCCRVAYAGPGLQRFAAFYCDRPEIVVNGDGPYDAVLVVSSGNEESGLSERLLALQPTGCMLALLPKDGATAGLDALLNNCSLVRYCAWTFDDAALVMAVRSEYDPIAHARALTKCGDFAGAMCALDLVPESMAPDDAAKARIAFEKQLCMHQFPAGGSADLNLHVLQDCQTWFYETVALAPDFLPAYVLQAELWSRLGDPVMARRLLASIHHAYPSDEAAKRRDKFASDTLQFEAPPIVETGGACRPIRILFLTHARPDYGLDTLYDGLCACLGDENVVEFPWKPSLHDAERATDTRYPCVFNRRGAPMDAAAVIAELRAGRFDALIFGVLDPDSDLASLRAIAAAAAALPRFLVDQQDNPRNNLPAAQGIAGIVGFDGYFKREMLRCGRYPENTWPLPFSYALTTEPPARARDIPLFWAGHRKLGLRRLYLEHLERRFAVNLDLHLHPEAYADALSRAVAGICIFGGGYDTVRYWELPAHGAMLIGERLPIHVPYDFTDGENALLFGDLAELEERVAFALAHPGDAARIAAAGRAHFIRHHTAEARARDLLPRIGPFLD